LSQVRFFVLDEAVSASYHTSLSWLCNEYNLGVVQDAGFV